MFSESLEVEHWPEIGMLTITEFPIGKCFG